SKTSKSASGTTYPEARISFASLLHLCDKLRPGVSSDCPYENTTRFITKQLHPHSHWLDGDRRAPAGAREQFQTRRAAAGVAQRRRGTAAGQRPDRRFLGGGQGRG